MRVISIFSIISLSLVFSEDSSTGEQKRDANKILYPTKGTWFKDTGTGKYYLKFGKSIFIQRKDSFYSKWVANENFDYELDKNHKWTWDKHGVLYSVLNNCSNADKENLTYVIPIICLAGKCPNQIRFPSGGLWHYTNCKLYYDIDDARFELLSDGFYQKWSSSNLGRNTQISPDRWTWDTDTGLWQRVANKENNIFTPNNLLNNYTTWTSNNRSLSSREAEMILPPPNED